jgi:hypothetical protein
VFAKVAAELQGEANEAKTTQHFIRKDKCRGTQADSFKVHHFVAAVLSWHAIAGC